MGFKGEGASAESRLAEKARPFESLLRSWLIRLSIAPLQSALARKGECLAEHLQS